MKRKTLFCLLSAEAALCIWCAFLWGKGEAVVAELSAFPFAQIAHGLRWLSLSGAAGNTVAIVLYVLFCAPCAVLFAVRLAQNRQQKGDFLLLVISAALFGVIYLLINPSGRPLLNHAVGSSMLGGCIYSLLLAYAAIRLRDAVKTAKTAKLYRLMDVLLIVLCVLLTFMMFFGSIAQVCEEIRLLEEGNTDVSALHVSYLVACLRGLVHALPYGLDVYVVFALRDMLLALARNQRGREVYWAGVTGKRCGQALVCITAVCAAFNVLQLLLSNTARQLHVAVHFPVGSMLLYVGALLLGRLVLEMKRIREENESFI